MSQSLQSMSGSPRAAGVTTGGRRGEGGGETCCTVSGAGVGQLTNIRFMHFSSWLVLHLTFSIVRNIEEDFSKQILNSQRADWARTSEKCDIFLTIYMFIQIGKVWHKLPALFQLSVFIYQWWPDPISNISVLGYEENNNSLITIW